MEDKEFRMGQSTSESLKKVAPSITKNTQALGNGDIQTCSNAQACLKAQI